jgi:hypothetical protein
MRRAIAVTCLVFLVGVSQAKAQATYSFSVSRHVSIPFSEQRVDDILAAASKMLKKLDDPDDLACDVTFKRIGPIQTFTSPNAEGVIHNRRERDAVHSENFDSSVINIKIVKKIEYCRPPFTGFLGCSWPHRFHSIIVVADQQVPQLVWPHEFGHQTGLWHRRPLDNALMSPCTLQTDNVQVTQRECKCFQKGPGGCKKPEPHPPVGCK